MLALLSCVSAEYCKESGVPPKARQVVYGCDFGAAAPRTMTSKAMNDAAMAHFIGIVTFPPPQRNTGMRPDIGLEADPAGQLHEPRAEPKPANRSRRRIQVFTRCIVALLHKVQTCARRW